MEIKVKSLFGLLQIESKKIKKEEATKILQIVFEMCTSELAASFAEIGYFSRDLIATEEISKVKESAKKQVEKIIEQIFKSQTEEFE